VNVISRKRLREFYEAKPERRRHGGAFEEWFKLTRKATWRSFQDTKALFGQTDVARDTDSGRTATIFDIGGNKYRIIAKPGYRVKNLFIRYVMTHEEYDENKWQCDCG